MQASKTIDNVYRNQVILETKMSSEETLVASGEDNYKKQNSAFKKFRLFRKQIANNKKYLLDPNVKLCIFQWDIFYSMFKSSLGS